MKKNTHIGSDFEDFLKEEGIFDEVEATAIKKILAAEIQKKLKEKHLTKTLMAKKLNTSRSSLDRMLNPFDIAITLKTIIRIVHALNMNIQLELIPNT